MKCIISESVLCGLGMKNELYLAASCLDGGLEHEMQEQTGTHFVCSVCVYNSEKCFRRNLMKLEF